MEWYGEAAGQSIEKHNGRKEIELLRPTMIREIIKKGGMDKQGAKFSRPHQKNLDLGARRKAKGKKNGVLIFKKEIERGKSKRS